MTRDELILSCQDTVRNLVRKYNNHTPDEDLEAVGMTAVIVCVDKCLDEGLTDVEQVQRRCNRWARNAILDTVYKERIKYVDDNSVLEVIEAEEDLWETIENIKTLLTPRDCEIFDCLCEGMTQEQIMKKLNIGKTAYFKHLCRIKEKIKR